MKSPAIPLGLAYTLLVIGGYAFYALRSADKHRVQQPHGFAATEPARLWMPGETLEYSPGTGAFSDLS